MRKNGRFEIQMQHSFSTVWAMAKNSHTLNINGFVFCHTNNRAWKCSRRPGIKRLRKAYEKVQLQECVEGWKSLAEQRWGRPRISPMPSRQLELGSGLRRVLGDKDADLGIICVKVMRNMQRAFQRSSRKGKKHRLLFQYVWWRRNGEK